MWPSFFLDRRQLTISSTPILRRLTPAIEKVPYSIAHRGKSLRFLSMDCMRPEQPRPHIYGLAPCQGHCNSYYSKNACQLSTWEAEAGRRRVTPGLLLGALHLRQLSSSCMSYHKNKGKAATPSELKFGSVLSPLRYQVLCSFS